MHKPTSQDLLVDISKLSLIEEEPQVKILIENIKVTDHSLMSIQANATRYAKIIRDAKSSAIESFIHEFSLSNEEGVAIMCLAESLLRIPDKETAMALVEDKLKDKDWAEHLGNSESLFVNASSWGLLVTGKLMKLKESNFSINRLLNRIGKPLVLQSIKAAIKIISNEYILGEDLKSALENAKKILASGYKISFDILGESARTIEQAEFYYDEYLKAIGELSKHSDKTCPIYNNHNLSVKLTALHAKVMYRKERILEAELLPKLRHMISLCKAANISLSFDAEEAFRQDIYLKILTTLVLESDFEGVGFVLQAYQKRTFKIIDYVATLAKQSGKRIPIRLVKGAYWDGEIKFAQEFGLEGYPVFTKKEYTDVSYLACAQKILSYQTLFYPQFATHNAHTVAAIIELAKGAEFEFQRLQGMGAALHNKLIEEGYKSRIYAPVGKYEDLLAYLMRRLLENGANSSFVNLVSDKSKSIAELVQNPIEKSVVSLKRTSNIPLPNLIYGSLRNNSTGYDLGYKAQYKNFSTQLTLLKEAQYEAYSIVNGKKHTGDDFREVYNPANANEVIGKIYYADKASLATALQTTEHGFIAWSAVNVYKRAEVIRKVAKLLQDHKFEIYSLLIREAGKTIDDAISELREAMDFAEYYATMAERACGQPLALPGYTGESNTLSWHPKGVFVCISPWNFPLAIFLGQILAALATGNSVLAKPADNTSLIATFAAKLIHKAGVPHDAFQLLVARSKDISEQILTSAKVKGVCFTGSSSVALNINRTLAHREAPIASIIAETGGQNAMIVDSSALLEQAADAIINSAFGSIGQRCSALRVLYVQEEVADKLENLLIGCMNQLKIGNTYNLECDIGPVISNAARKELETHIKVITKKKGCSLIAVHHQTKDASLKNGNFFMPHIISIRGISDLMQENFGPVLHIIRYKAKELNGVIAEINATGYGLTFGLQTRIEERIQQVASKVHAGNFYANRTIIGAMVGTQPFGGENNSGTGFKAGGPYYLFKFMNERVVTINTTAIGGNLDLLKR
ncbi:MAG: bifunctional proline dehydrogenase/L-glutamate gamma-semialdehyde dehydrogenase PutA [Candidatus Jidaibacter sp.]|jgi:RHH-type proline utilization regulon transcriptional repressor/proline dehydrogenase/delta 1-pyrroline-5-carboxylate dehydrogenase|nr:bifunctional proline dehydrogenase/L-glutamate gamma-semialdehyde dehydrogenase PutA [Candidatus Jidaibacter sp.]